MELEDVQINKNTVVTSSHPKRPPPRPPRPPVTKKINGKTGNFKEN